MLWSMWSRSASLGVQERTGRQAHRQCGPPPHSLCRLFSLARALSLRRVLIAGRRARPCTLSGTLCMRPANFILSCGSNMHPCLAMRLQRFRVARCAVDSFRSPARHSQAAVSIAPPLSRQHKGAECPSAHESGTRSRSSGNGRSASACAHTILQLQHRPQ